MSTRMRKRRRHRKAKVDPRKALYRELVRRELTVERPPQDEKGTGA